MTDEEKTSDIYDICLEKKSIYCNRKMGEETCSKCKTYKMYKLGLAEGRKEKQTIIDIQTVEIESRDIYLTEKESIIIKQQIEIQNLKKEKWHDLRENPNDLPKERGGYLILHEDNTGFTHYSIRDFRHGYFECTNTIIAWTEIPRFKE